MDVIVIFTCHNRAEKTKRCIMSLLSGNPLILFQFVVVNDGSSDDTSKILKEINNQYNCITEIIGDGDLYYSKGMRKGMKWINSNQKKAKYILLVNDDVDFLPNTIEKLIEESIIKNDAIIVGATKDYHHNFSYGGVKYKTGTINYELISCEQCDVRCDTFNANCVLIPWQDYVSVEPMDGSYAHACGDFDYGFSLSRSGAMIYTSSFYVGYCIRNTIAGTWHDTTLNRIERIKKKEQAKGLPLQSWLHYLYKNFGLKQMIIHGFTPYIKIIIGK